jgi:hypothetical protein
VAASFAFEFDCHAQEPYMMMMNVSREIVLWKIISEALSLTAEASDTTTSRPLGRHALESA